jgi:hypothetical protein
MRYRKALLPLRSNDGKLKEILWKSAAFLAMIH